LYYNLLHAKKAAFTPLLHHLPPRAQEASQKFLMEKECKREEGQEGQRKQF
jgi:hypothetical protein